MQPNKDNLIIKLTFQFSLNIINYCEKLNQEKKFQLSNQLFKSSTSIGANAREAQNAESISDFVHKMKIAAKEADESDYWLQLCKLSSSYPDPGNLCIQIHSITNILSKIITTTKKKSINKK